MECCLLLLPNLVSHNLEALLKYFQTSHQIDFNKCHHSKQKEGQKVTSSANIAAPQAEWEGELAGFTPITLSLGASQIRTNNMSCDITNFIRLDFNCRFQL